MRGGLLGAGHEDRRDHPDLAVGGVSGGAEAPAPHALSRHSQGSGGSASRIVIGRSVVAGQCLSPRPTSNVPVELEDGRSGRKLSR